MTKRQRSTRRRQRAKAKVLCAIDFETRCPMEFGTRVHQNIETLMSGRYHIGDSHVGDSHPGQSDEQLMAYGRLAGLETVMIMHGGDIVQHIPVHVGEFDLRRARAAMDEFMISLRNATGIKDNK